MNIIYNSNVLGYGVKSPFEATGGTGPYTYSVLEDGLTGLIDSVTGVYTSPSAPSIDTIRAVDSLGSEAYQEVHTLSPIGLLCDIIKRELDLSYDQVYIYNQKFNIPPDMRLYVAVGVGAVKPFSNVNRTLPDGSTEQYANFQATLEVNIISKNEDALIRKEEVLLAFNSNYAKNQQSLNSFHLGKLTSQFTNLSQVEGAGIPFRFNISVQLQYAFKKVRVDGYYDTFPDVEILTNL